MREPPTVSQLFCHCLGLRAPASLKPDSRATGLPCCLRHCGRTISVGYAVQDIVTEATNEFMDTFRGQSDGFMCCDCATLFSQDHNLGAWLLFEDGTAFSPLISRDSAMAEPPTEAPAVKRAPKIDRSGISRPCWSDLVRCVWPSRQGQLLCCLLTTNTKKRQWPRAVVGPLGHATPLYLHDGPDEAVRCVDWAVLLTCLDTIEAAYTQGFSKESIRTSLLSQTKAIAALGLRATLCIERSLAPLRSLEEFTPALLIAQKSVSTASQEKL